jgi:hypothetical protein
MAKLPPMDWRAQEVRGLLNEGRTKEAKRRVAAILRDGHATAQVQAIAAEMLEPPSRGRGRPKAKLPSHWYEIGTTVENMRYDGMTYDNAILKAADDFRKDPETIRRADKFYRDAKDEADPA